MSLDIGQGQIKFSHSLISYRLLWHQPTVSDSDVWIKMISNQNEKTDGNLNPYDLKPITHNSKVLNLSTEVKGVSL